VLKAAALIIGLAIVAVGVWSGSELHYQSCIAAAEARTPIWIVRVPNENLFGGGGTSDVARGGQARQRAVAGCSRLPF
jgi:hypothetical protein